MQLANGLFHRFFVWVDLTIQREFGTAVSDGLAVAFKPNVVSSAKQAVLARR